PAAVPGRLKSSRLHCLKRFRCALSFREHRRILSSPLLRPTPSLFRPPPHQPPHHHHTHSRQNPHKVVREKISRQRHNLRTKPQRQQRLDQKPQKPPRKNRQHKMSQAHLKRRRRQHHNLERRRGRQHRRKHQRQEFMPLERRVNLLEPL